MARKKPVENYLLVEESRETAPLFISLEKIRPFFVILKFFFIALSMFYLQEPEMTSSGQSISTTDPESACSSRESSQSTPTPKLGLKVFQSRTSTSSLFDKMTDTVGTESSVFFGPTRQAVR